ncbi:unnamed protein product, partial [Brassica oleracea var. botrytis]
GRFTVYFLFVILRQSSVFSDSNRHRNDRQKVKKKMKRLAALIASAGCAFMGLCDFALSREYE